MKNYKHLSLGQRYQIQSLFNIGLSQTKIAEQLNVHHSTISRKLKRGRTARLYIGKHAPLKTDKCHSDKKQRVYLNESLKKRIAGLMSYEKWSPELIYDSLRKESENCISHETIYKCI